MEEQELLEKLLRYGLAVRNLTGDRLRIGIIIYPEKAAKTLTTAHPELTTGEIYKGLEELAKKGTLEIIYLLPKKNIPEEYK